MRVLRSLASLALLFPGSSALALDYELGDVQFNLKSRFSAGAAMRMQERSNGLVGKQNVEGQQSLCVPDNCLSLFGDPAPNQRLIDAEGAFFGTNRDDGNLNYDQYDIVTGLTKLNMDLKVTWTDFLFRVRGLGYHDPANVDFEQTHVNTLYQPASTRRSGDTEGYYAKGAELLDAYVQYSSEVAGHAVAFSVGRQILRWGESGLTALNSIAEINPPNQVLLHSPGTEIGELFQPTSMALLSVDLFEGVAMEVLYQYAWEPVKADARGSFFSDIDIFGNDGGEPLSISLGQFPEDPDGKQRFAGVLGLLSDSNANARLLPLKTGEPKGGGQYGVKFSYYADWLNDGTELGLYYLNYHSRLPYLSLYAADDSCARDSSLLTVAFDCELDLSGLATGDPIFNKEALTIDTLRVFLDYPEDIHMFGISANTTAFGWSFAGEYSFRDNLPLQVGITDVIFAGLQPTFPVQDLAIGTSAIPALGLLLSQLGLGVDVLTLPSARHAIPDFVSVYRGLNNSDPNNRINGGQLVRGYERAKVGQFDFLGVQVGSPGTELEFAL